MQDNKFLFCFVFIFMNSTFSIEAQISNICRVCYLGLCDISKIRQYLTEETTKPLIMAYVMSKLDCNNDLLFEVCKVCKSFITKLQIIQNNADHVITRKRRYDSIEHYRKDLHWLPIDYKIKYKLLLLTFKSINNIAPSYLCNLLTP